MDGKELVVVQHPEGHWTASDGTKSTAGLLIEGKGNTETNALSDFMSKKASIVPQTVSQQTLDNKAKVVSQVDAVISRLRVTRLKSDNSFVAYRSDNPDVQGYGKNENAAKVDLFNKEKKQNI